MVNLAYVIRKRSRGTEEVHSEVFGRETLVATLTASRSS